MEMSARLALHAVIVAVLLACSPADAWYKQVAGPSYYSVGRASGLLSGIRRSPYVKRFGADPSDGGESASNSVISQMFPQGFVPKTVPFCIKDITPNLQSCEPLEETKGSYKCQAAVLLSVDSSDCAGD